MATPIRDAMINNSSKDGTGDAIEGSEVDANPNTLADLLDGTSTTVWGQAGQVSFETLGIKEDAVAAGAVKDKWVYEWDPSDGSNLTDNSSGLGMVWKMPDDADNQTEFANLDIMCNDDAASSEDAEFVFSTVINATMREVFSVGSQGATFNEASQDLDFRIETDNIANGFIVDAGLDVFSFGAAAADDKFVTISPPAAAHTADTDTYALHVTAGGAQTIPTGTTALVASLAVEEPNITATGTVTNAATVYIKNAPNEGDTGNYALWIDAGASQLDGTLTVGGIIKTDDTTEATSTTDGSLQTDGGLSVVKDAIFGDDVRLLSDSAVLSLGAGNDATLTHDGTTGVTIAANPITITSGGAATWSTSSGALTVTSAAALNLNPASGSAIVLDGTINVDAGVVTGATSITLSGELDAGSLDISGNADIDGTLETDALSIDGTAITTTAAEINLIDGGTSRGTDAVASGDGILINDAGTMKMTNVDTVSTYFSSHNVGGGNIVTTGALNSGSITSGFGTINNGSSTITTTGAVSTGALTSTSIDCNGNADISGDLTLSAGADGALTFANAGENSIKIPDNQASALIIEEANAAYLTFVTTNSGEKVTISQNLDFDSGTIDLSTQTVDVTLNDAVDSLNFDSNTLSIDASNNRIGINTAAPTGVLNVSGNHLNPIANLALATNYAIVIECSPTTGEGNGIAFTNDDGGSVGAAIIHIDRAGANAGDLAFYTKPHTDPASAPTERMRIELNGKVGIGVDDPLGNLHVQASDVSASPGGYADNFIIEENSDAGMSIISGTNSRGSIQFGDTTAAMGEIHYKHGTGDEYLSFRVNSTNDVLRLDSTGNVFINDTENDFQTTGLTINQGAADDTIFNLKSTDVAHPMTALADADTFASFTKGAGATAGGLQLEAFSSANADGGGRTLILVASAGDTTLQTTHASSTVGAMEFYVRKSNGSTAATAIAADEAGWTWSNNTSTVLLLQGEGEMHIANTTLVALDDYDDNQLLRAGELATNSAGITRSRWDDAIPYNIDTLKDLGVLSEDGSFWSLQKRISLNANASWQNHCSIRVLQENINAMRLELLETKTKIERLADHA